MDVKIAIVMKARAALMLYRVCKAVDRIAARGIMRMIRPSWSTPLASALKAVTISVRMRG